MLLKRTFKTAALVLLGLLGLAMTLDQRFVSFSEIRQQPVLAAYYYAPTALFAVIGLIQYRRGTFWPVVAFIAGLMGTGLFHQYVAGIYHENPGYMFPGGHILAPFVSVVAYLFALLTAWGIAKVLRRRTRSETPHST